MKRLLIVSLMFLAAPLAWSAIEFDGDGDYVNIGGDTDALAVTNDFTFSLWMKHDQTTDNDYVYVRATSSWTYQHAVISGYSDGNVEFYASGYSGSDPRAGSQIAIPDTTSWHHYCYSYDGTTWAGYRDGSQIFSVSRTFSLAQATGASVECRIGNASSDASSFDGQVACMIVYSNGLSQSEVELIAKSKLCRITTQIQNSDVEGRWWLDDGAAGATANGATAYDSSVNGYNATGTNGVWRGMPLSYAQFIGQRILRMRTASLEVSKWKDYERSRYRFCGLPL